MSIAKLRKAWIALYKESKGSAEEKEAYQIYIMATQGIKVKEAKSHEKKPSKVD